MGKISMEDSNLIVLSYRCLLSFWLNFIFLVWTDHGSLHAVFSWRHELNLDGTKK